MSTDESDALDKALKELLKGLEKELIRQIGSNSVQTSLSKKENVKAVEKSKVQSLKSSTANYISAFQTSAKGQWVNQVKINFQNTSDKIDGMNWGE